MLYKVFLLFFLPAKLAKLASKNEQSYENALQNIVRIRRSYFRAFITIILLSTISLEIAFVIKELGGLNEDHLSVLRFVSSMFIALAVLAKLGWEIQTYDGDTIPEQANSYIFQLFYQIGVVGMLSSLLTGT